MSKFFVSTLIPGYCSFSDVFRYHKPSNFSEFVISLLTLSLSLITTINCDLHNVFIPKKEEKRVMIKKRRIIAEKKKLHIRRSQRPVSATVPLFPLFSSLPLDSDNH